MVKITFFQNQAQQFVGFTCLGHASDSDGPDIVCAGVSALVVTCINSIETLTQDRFSCEEDAESGSVVFRLCDGFGERSQLLLQSLALGLEEMEGSYEENIDLIFEEV